MKTILRGLALFYGVQMFLVAAGLAVYCCLAQQPFGERVGEQLGDNALLLMALAALPQGGIGLLLIWFGVSPELKANFLDAIRKLIHWLATH